MVGCGWWVVGGVVVVGGGVVWVKPGFVLLFCEFGCDVKERCM